MFSRGVYLGFLYRGCVADIRSRTNQRNYRIQLDLILRCVSILSLQYPRHLKCSVALRSSYYSCHNYLFSVTSRSSTSFWYMLLADIWTYVKRQAEISQGSRPATANSRNDNSLAWFGTLFTSNSEPKWQKVKPVLQDSNEP